MGLRAAAWAARAFLAIRLVALLLELAPLGMAENDVADGKLLQHARGDLARKGAVVVLAHVLRAQADGAVEHGLGNLAQGGEGRADDDIDLGEVGQFEFQPLDQGQRLGHRLVHLPIAGDNEFAFFVHEINGIDFDAAIIWRRAPPRREGPAPPEIPGSPRPRCS